MNKNRLALFLLIASAINLIFGTIVCIIDSNFLVDVSLTIAFVLAFVAGFSIDLFKK